MHDLVDFTRKWVVLLGGVSDCEELVGGYSQEMMGLVLVNYLVKYLVNLIIGSPALI